MRIDWFTGIYFSGGVEGTSSDDLVLYLVKWRGQPYDQASWEHFKDIRFASDQILNFWDFCRPSAGVSLSRRCLGIRFFFFLVNETLESIFSFFSGE